MSFRKSIKRLGRKTAKARVKVGRIVTPIVAAGAGYFGGAPAAAAVTAIGAQAAYYNRATQARNEGLQGRDARARGRGERKRVAIYGAAAGGAGVLGSAATGIIAGKGFGSILAQGAFGQYGSQLLGTGSTLFESSPQASSFVTPNNLLAQKGAPVPGLVTQSQLAASLSGGTSTPEAAAAAAAAKGGDSTLAKALGLGTTLLKDLPGTPGGANPKTPGDGTSYDSGYLNGLLNGMGGGGGGGGDSGGGGGGFMNAPPMEGDKSSNGILLALGLGALLLLG